MNGRRKVPVVGSYAVLKSIAQHPRVPPPTPEKPPAPARKEKPRKKAQALTHTVRPTRHALLCYHCDEEFDVLGHHRFTLCPRCHKRVDVVDYTLEGEFDREVRTAGKVHIAAGAAVRGGSIKASQVSLDGAAEAGRIETIHLAVCAEGRINTAISLHFRDLSIGPGADVSFEQPLACRSLRVAGRLKAAAEIETGAVIEAGGDFEGRLAARHLRVDDGAGLRGDLVVKPTDGENPP